MSTISASSHFLGHSFLCLHPRQPTQRHALRRRNQRSRPSHVRAQREVVPGFTRRYGIDKLVYFEEFGSINEARAREYALKRWKRAWKLELIEKLNPEWRDLSAELVL